MNPSAPMSFNERYGSMLLLVIMLFAAVLAIVLKPNIDDLRKSPSVNLEQMIPIKFGDWQVDESVVPLAVAPDMQDVIERTYDSTLARTYINSKMQRVMLSIAYTGAFTDRATQYHRPEICYPAQGFEIRDSHSDQIKTAIGDIPARRLDTKNGDRREFVTYWVTVAGRRTTYGFGARWLQLKSYLSGELPNALQIRISTIGSNSEEAYRQQDDFANVLLRNLHPGDAEKLAGTASKQFK